MTEKEKRERKPSETQKKKGFYTAIYASIAVMLLIAAAIGYTNLNSAKNSLAKNTEEPETAQVGSNLDQSYMPPLSLLQNNDPVFDSNQIVTNPEDEDESGNLEDDYFIPVDNPAKKPDKSIPTEQTPATSAPPNSSIDNTAAPSNTVLPSEQQATEKPKADASSETFTAFTDESKLEWPVFGNIVMDYSMDHLIYDVTLEYYRTNNNLCIAAEVGSQVHAATDGIVSDIFTSRELGKSVVIDHGNGWKTTYSQLQDGVLVEVGDVVRTGQVIGGVGNPSIYSVLLGNHLAFSVSNNDSYVNPKNLLQN